MPDIYSKQAREGKNTPQPGKQGLRKGFWASLSALTAGHSILEWKCKTEETSVESATHAEVNGSL